MAKHDENKCLASISRIAQVDYVEKVIYALLSTNIGNKRWGRIDFLTHYCGWRFVWVTGGVTINKAKSTITSEKKKYTKADKKDAKAPKLTNKNKKK